MENFIYWKGFVTRYLKDLDIRFDNNFIIYRTCRSFVCEPDDIDKENLKTITSWHNKLERYLGGYLPKDFFLEICQAIVDEYE